MPGSEGARPSRAIRVVVAHGAPPFRAACRQAFAEAEWIHMVGEAEDGPALGALLKELDPPADVAVAALDTVVSEWLQAIGLDDYSSGALGAIVLTGLPEPVLIVERGGGRVGPGSIVKRELDDLIGALRMIAGLKG
ncbi:MAG TPA: hypothetical protein VF972_06250 [Actinomycetota bacterium]